MMDHIRKLGLVVEAEDGKVMLRSDFIAAEKDVPLTPEQAKILAHLKLPIAYFQIAVDSVWSAGTFEEF